MHVGRTVFSQIVDVVPHWLFQRLAQRHVRWIKQNLRIRAFYGTSPNAIRVQLWSAICTYLCVAITRKRLRLPQNLTTVLQIVSVHALHKVPLAELFAENDITPPPDDIPEQLTFSDL